MYQAPEKVKVEFSAIETIAAGGNGGGTGGGTINPPVLPTLS